jgi:hypothetical protein
MMFARAGGVATLIALGGFIGVMFRKERTKQCTISHSFPSPPRASLRS